LFVVSACIYKVTGLFVDRALLYNIR